MIQFLVSFHYYSGYCGLQASPAHYPLGSCMLIPTALMLVLLVVSFTDSVPGARLDTKTTHIYRHNSSILYVTPLEVCVQQSVAVRGTPPCEPGALFRLETKGQLFLVLLWLFCQPTAVASQCVLRVREDGFSIIRSCFTFCRYLSRLHLHHFVARVIISEDLGYP